MSEKETIFQFTMGLGCIIFTFTGPDLAYIPYLLFNGKL